MAVKYFEEDAASPDGCAESELAILFALTNPRCPKMVAYIE